MGDYVNRGQQSTEVIVLLFALLVRFPDRIVMLRGNHESATITKVYGFYDECKRRHSIKLWNQFVNAFNSMPLVALIDDKIMCMHGGISPSMESFKDVENFDRPLDIPSEGLITDLMWNDPDEEATDWTENERGCGQVFGPRQLEEFLGKFDLDLICRGHQVMEDGYGFFGEARQLVTVFSAKNYTGDFDNDAAVMSVDENLQC